jgi:signal transduction histidine kinase
MKRDPSDLAPAPRPPAFCARRELLLYVEDDDDNWEVAEYRLSAHFKQVLINLLANAIKFSEEGTTVTVRWRSLPDAEVVEIIDCGIGIAAENHERIFTSFEQVHTRNVI